MGIILLKMNVLHSIFPVKLSTIPSSMLILKISLRISLIVWLAWRTILYVHPLTRWYWNSGLTSYLGKYKQVSSDLFIIICVLIWLETVWDLGYITLKTYSSSTAEISNNRRSLFEKRPCKISKRSIHWFPFGRVQNVHKLIYSSSL